MNTQEMLNDWIINFTKAMIRERRTKKENIVGITRMLNRAVRTCGKIKCYKYETVITKNDLVEFGGNEAIEKLVVSVHDGGK